MIVIGILLMAIVFIAGVYLQILLGSKDIRFIENDNNFATDQELEEIRNRKDPVSLIKQIGYYEEEIRFLFLPRLIIPSLLAILVFIGMPIYGFVGMFDSQSDINFLGFLYLALKGAVFSIALLIKSYFSVFVFSISLITFIYFLFEHGDIKILMILEGFFSWVFSESPKWMANVYAVVIILYSLFSSIHDFSYDELS